MVEKSIIGLKKYSKKFDKELFQEIDINLEGDYIFLLGENGSGKTTIMSELYELNKDRVSYIEQNFHLFENATGKDNIKIVDDNVDESLLDKLGIKNIYTKKITKMSAGERQRVICYIALSAKKEWLFIDELDNHLDLDNSKNVYSLLNDKRENILAISHFNEVATQ